MKYRKIAALTLSLIMAVSVAACGSSSDTQKNADDNAATPSTESNNDAEPAGGDSAESTDITLWTYPIGNWGDSATVDGLISNFETAHPDINVTVRVSGLHQW